METVDSHVLKLSVDFMQKAVDNKKPFFVWANPSRMHVFTYLSPKYDAMITPENGWSIQEAGMAEFDDFIGGIMKKLDAMGVTKNTIIIVTTDNGTETFTWPDGGNTPFKGEKGMATEGGFRSPCVIRWPGKVKPNQVINGVMSGLDWLQTFVAAAGNPNIKDELLKGKTLGGKTYKVHLDGYDQTNMLTKGGKTARNEFWYFTQSTLAAARIGDFKYVLLDQPDGWVGQTVRLNFPQMYNLRLDPFERLDFNHSWLAFENFYGREFWRLVFFQQEVGKLAKTAIEYPPMQAVASFNLDAVKRKIQAASAAQGQ
jgi:arylsulfatase